MAKAKMATKVAVGDKIRIVNAHEHYSDYYTNGAEGFVVGVYDYDYDCIDVKFTNGWLCEDVDSQEFHVFKEEYEVISNESKTQTKKEKEMGNQIKMKQGVYSVVNVVTGEVIVASRNREHARAQLQHAKTKADNPKDLKLAKMQVEKWVR